MAARDIAGDIRIAPAKKRKSPETDLIVDSGPDTC
jgi:hypothetical protein